VSEREAGHFWNRCPSRNKTDYRRGARCEGKKNHIGSHFADDGFYDLEWEDDHGNA
jgi:hypothetical protein